MGFFSLEVATFVWDLCLLAGWSALQPALCSALICLRVSLFTCARATEVKLILAAQGSQITISQLQRMLTAHFMAGIRKELAAPPPQQAFELTPGGSWS